MLIKINAYVVHSMDIQTLRYGMFLIRNPLLDLKNAATDKSGDNEQYLCMCTSSSSYKLITAEHLYRGIYIIQHMSFLQVLQYVA